MECFPITDQFPATLLPSRNFICEGISRRYGTRERKEDPRNVDCPIDTILGEIKGNAFVVVSRSAPPIKHTFVSVEFVESEPRVFSTS